MSNYSALIDADCLHKLYIRGILLDLASLGFYKPRWSQKILDETARSLSRRFSMSQEQLDKHIYQLSGIFSDSTISGFDHLVGTLGCKDPDDEHVLAAAICGKVDAIVTFNGKDFPSDTYDRFQIEVCHPDEFLLDQIDLNTEAGLLAICIFIESYNKPEMSASQVAEALRKAGCEQFAAFVDSSSALIDEQVHHLRIVNQGLPS